MSRFDHAGLTLQGELGSGSNLFPIMNPMLHWTNLGDLFDGPDTRIITKVIPHVEGEKPLGARIGKSVRVLEGLVDGSVDIHNDPYANAVDGLSSNINYINYYGGSAWSPAADRTRTFRFTKTSGTKYGPVLATFKTGKTVGPGLKLATLELQLTEGGLWH
jgi:hypothetical protein